MSALVEQSAAAAAAAAARAGVDIHPIGDADASHQVSQLFSEVWAPSLDSTIVPAEIIRSLAHANNYSSMAVAGTEVVGAALGFLGGDDRGTYLHSFIAGVRQGWRGANVGFALKQDQRAWALAHGLTRVTWTFDPLARRNAYFNLVKLGATATEFHRDFYGSMQDALNAGDQSDRILIEWQLDSPRAVEASELGGRPIDAAAFDTGLTRLLVGDDGTPEIRTERGTLELVQVPEDIVALRQADPDLGRRWRLALRETLGTALDEGCRAEGITRDGWYILRRLTEASSPLR